MVTLVALIEATAMTPGAKPSWSAASRLIRETTRNGPATMSTWAITWSRVTLVTMPVRRLRAECSLGLVGQGGGEGGQGRAVDVAPPVGVARDRKPAAVGPAPDGVVAHPEKAGGLADPIRRHGRMLPHQPCFHFRKL
jgi:hypothetical protein